MKQAFSVLHAVYILVFNFLRVHLLQISFQNKLSHSHQIHLRRTKSRNTIRRRNDAGMLRRG